MADCKFKTCALLSKPSKQIADILCSDVRPNNEQTNEQTRNKNKNTIYDFLYDSGDYCSIHKIFDWPSCFELFDVAPSQQISPLTFIFETKQHIIAEHKQRNPTMLPLWMARIEECYGTRRKYAFSIIFFFFLWKFIAGKSLCQAFTLYSIGHIDCSLDIFSSKFHYFRIKIRINPDQMFALRLSAFLARPKVEKTLKNIPKNYYKNMSETFELKKKKKKGRKHWKK